MQANIVSFFNSYYNKFSSYEKGDGKKVIVNMVENPNIKETKITIECSKADSQILKIISLINNYENNDKKIIGI